MSSTPSHGRPDEPPILASVASGRSPVTADDMAYVVERVAALPQERIRNLTAGSIPGPDECCVCWALRRTPERYSADEKKIADDLLAWHGSDAIRCGVIYGIAAAVNEKEQR